MVYQVIARKWRPQTFVDLVGQETLVRTLQNSIEYNRLHHAYLFHGTRGVGKTTTARILAKALNCSSAEKPTITPCGICDSCKEIARGKCIDVLEIDAASNTGVENIKDIIVTSIGLSPANGRYKVFIIDEVHMLSPAAFNALLKTLEEPPPRRIFILATTELHKLPETVLSRCQVFPFKPITLPKIAERLRLIAETEKITVTDQALKAIARVGEGSMRDAQSAFDQVISSSGETITVEDVETSLGLVSADILIETIQAIADKTPTSAFEIVEKIIGKGQDLRVFCQELLGHFRDLILLRNSGDLNLVRSTLDSDELNRQIALFSHQDLVRFFNLLEDTESRLRTANNPQYLVEIGLIKLMEMRSLTDLRELITRLDKLDSKPTK